MLRFRYAVLVLFASLCFAEEPRCVDPRLTLELFAASPKIVQPVSAIVDGRGRLLVIENHTHFRPDDYAGPETDRIVAVQDTDADGRADLFKTFFSGERDSMDLALHPDGSVYLATRRKILRLEDRDDDGQVDEVKLIVRLETSGDYPHNGLSGLAFDAEGNLYFGFGENLGAAYSLIGSDSTRLEGQGEGGTTYRCTADGKALRRTATGFWNPFGQCVDAFGNVFAVDNDPDASPPCRLLHVVDGANFGYQFRYGRSGKHPLQTWTGQLPGTLSMVAGTGEAPCEVIYYHASGLPQDYLGSLMVASWGDHRIECFHLTRKGATFEAERQIIVQGDAQFRPVGIALAQDGSLFITDWASRSYPLHGEGKVWHLRARQHAAPSELTPEQLVLQRAKKLEWDRFDRAELIRIAQSDSSVAVRAAAVRIMGIRGQDVSSFASADQPLAVRHQALTYLTTREPDLIAAGLECDDAVVFTAAVQALVRNRQDLVVDWFTEEYVRNPGPSASPRLLVGIALACEAADDRRLAHLIPHFLASPNSEVRFVAARWAADRDLREYSDAIETAIALENKNFRFLLGLLAARNHLQGGQFDDALMARWLRQIIADPKQDDQTKLLALRSAKAGSLDVDAVQSLMMPNREPLMREAIYCLAGDQRAPAIESLNGIVGNSNVPDGLRADALVAVDYADHDPDRLLQLAATGTASELAKTALRLLTGSQLTSAQRTMLETKVPPGALRDRVLTDADNQSGTRRNANAWLAEGIPDGDPGRGRRLFHNVRLLQCVKCHAVENRGASIGPDLTSIGRTQSTQQLLRSILYPSERIAPQYQPWIIVDKNGLSSAGYHLASRNSIETFVDATGRQFDVHQDQIATRMTAEKSIMPDGLVDHLSEQEMSDLLAFLSNE